MGKVITFSLQKGGTGKSTTSGITSYILSQQGYKVLAVDLDSQGNLGELLSQRDIYDFYQKTILEALKEKDPRNYIYKINDNLHLIPSEDHLATFSRYLYTEVKTNNPLEHSLILKETLDKVIDEYDFIILDTPPALGDITINAFSASDYIVAMFETSKFAYSALSRFLETIVHVQEKVNPKLEVIGILATMIDSRRSDSKAFIELIQEEYKDLVFDTIIKRKAATGRLSINGFFDNPEINDAIEQYTDFVEELKARV